MGANYECPKPDRQRGPVTKCTSRGLTRIGKTTQLPNPRSSAANLCQDLPSLTVGLLTPLVGKSRHDLLQGAPVPRARRDVKFLFNPVIRKTEPAGPFATRHDEDGPVLDRYHLKLLGL